MTTPRFAIAKVIPDLTRMEPRNFGVIVWNRGECLCRFIGDDISADSKHLSRLDLPSRDSYFQWIEYWRHQLTKGSIKTDAGESIDRSDSKFLDALCSKSLDNFQLVSAGYLTTAYPASKTSSVLTSLYESVVISASNHEKQAKAMRLHHMCEKMLAPLIDDERLEKNFEVILKSDNADFPPRFTYGFGDKSEPDVLLQSVSLSNEDQVRSTAQKFQCVSEQEGIIDKNHCACLIDAAPGRRAVLRRIAFLSRFSQVISLSNPDQARATLSQMGLSLSS